MITTLKRFEQTTAAYGAGHHEHGKATDKGIIALMSKWDDKKIIETYFELFQHSPNTDNIEEVKKEIRTKFLLMRKSNQIEDIKKYFDDDLNLEIIEENTSDANIIDTIKNDLESIAESICLKLNGSKVSDWPDSDIENPFDPSVWMEINVESNYNDLLNLLINEVRQYTWNDLVTPEVLGGENNIWSISIGLSFIAQDPRD